MPLVKSVIAKLSATGTEDALLRIGRVSAAAEALGKLHPEIVPTIESSRALLEARLLRAGIRAELAGAAEGGGGGGGLFGGLLGKIGGAAGGAAGAGGGILSRVAGWQIGPLPLGAWAGLAAAGVLVHGAFAGVLGIIPLLAAATAGVGAFGALALPTFSKIAAGVTAVGAATTKAGLAKAWAAIPEALRPAVRGVIGLQDAFGKLVTGLQPVVLKITGIGLQIAGKLLPFVGQFARAAAPAILTLLQGLDKFAGSPGFKTFMDKMAALAGPAIKTIGEGLGKVAVAAGKLLEAMISPRGILFLGLLFKGLAGLLNVVTWMIPRLTALGDTIGHFVSGTVRFFSQWKTDASAAFHGVVDLFTKFPGQILTVLGGLAHLLTPGGKLLIRGLIDGISSMLPGLGSIIGTVLGVIGSLARALGSLPGLPSGINAPGNAPHPHGGHGPVRGGGGVGALALAGAVHFHVNVYPTPLTSPADTGREVANALAAYMKNGGWVYRPRGI